MFIYKSRHWGETKHYISIRFFHGDCRQEISCINIYMCFLSNRDLSMASFMTTDCEKKQWLNLANGERKEKPDVLSVGLPAANYSFFAEIPENNISYIAFQHEQEQTHPHIYIYKYIYIHIYIYTSENLGENQNNISIRFFHGACHQEIEYVYIYI